MCIPGGSFLASVGVSPSKDHFVNIILLAVKNTMTPHQSTPCWPRIQVEPSPPPAPPGALVAGRALAALAPRRRCRRHAAPKLSCVRCTCMIDTSKLGFLDRATCKIRAHGIDHWRCLFSQIPNFLNSRMAFLAALFGLSMFTNRLTQQGFRKLHGSACS